MISLSHNRWIQLFAGILSLVAIANFQYAWTFFVLPLQHRHGWSRESIQVAFSVFLFAQTTLVPVEGYLAERFGPRRFLIAGSILVALAWVMNAYATSLAVLYVAQALSGCGAGIAYGISMGNALKWFPDRRGLAAGLTAAAFGIGSAATVLPIQATIKNSGYEAAFIWFGLGQGLVVFLCALIVRFPDPEELPITAFSKTESSGREFTPAEGLTAGFVQVVSELVRSPAFWLLYAMMTVGAMPGLFMTAQMAPMAADFEVAETPVSFLWITLPALSFATMLDRITGGLTRPVFGWISDKIGRERAIFAAFALEGTALFLLILDPRNPVTFVVMSGIAFFGWGAIFSLFPATTGDLFGRKFATTNYGVLYTAKGMASLLILGANRLQAHSNSWVHVFALMIAFDWLAALLAIFCLRPLRMRMATPQIEPASAAATR